MAVAQTVTETREFPKKLYYKINEVAQITRLKPHVLRYWETEFKELAPLKDENDQRRYRLKDLELIFEIQHLLYHEGFTIKGARQQLKQKSNRRAALPAAPAPPAAPRKLGAKPAKSTARKDRKVTFEQLNQRFLSVKQEIRALHAFLKG